MYKKGNMQCRQSCFLKLVSGKKVKYAPRLCVLSALHRWIAVADILSKIRNGGGNGSELFPFPEASRELWNDTGCGLMLRMSVSNASFLIQANIKFQSLLLSFSQTELESILHKPAHGSLSYVSSITKILNFNPASDPSEKILVCNINTSKQSHLVKQYH